MLADFLVSMVSISICHLNWTPSQLYLSDCYLPFSRIVLKIDCVWLSYEVVNVPKQHGQHCSDIEKTFEIWDWAKFHYKKCIIFNFLTRLDYKCLKQFISVLQNFFLFVESFKSVACPVPYPGFWSQFPVVSNF
jgi:hypothetical protein